MSSRVDKSLDSKAIKNFHDQIVNCLKKHLLQTDATNCATIDSFGLRSSLEWEKAPPGQKLELHYCVPQKERYRTAKQELGERSRTRVGVPVFPLRSSQRTWISWFEKLLVTNNNNFKLLGVSLGLWSGESGEKMQPLLRVEWDRLSDDDLASKALRAQPHWQLDVPVGAHEVGAPNSHFELSTDLQELPAGDGLEVLPERDTFNEKQSMAFDLSPYHLGMRAEGPWGQVNWQHSWKQEFQELPAWLDNCLLYLINQEQHFPHKRVLLNSA